MLLASRLRSLSSVLFACLAASACAERNAVVPGTYATKGEASAAAPAVRVTIAETKAEVSFATGASVIKRTATPREQAKWPMLCPRGMKDTSSEVLDLGDEPLVLGAMRVERPALVAECLGKPIVELRTRDLDGKGLGPMRLSFAR